MARLKSTDDGIKRQILAGEGARLGKLADNLLAAVERIGVGEQALAPFPLDPSERATMAELTALYKYGFGDSWEHEIIFEGYPNIEKGQNYPMCFEGERACPPEDVGGVSGYAEFAKTISDGDNEDRVETLE